VKHSITKSLQRDNFKVRLILKAEITMSFQETDNLLEMLAACKGSDQGLKIKPDPGGYPYKGVFIEEIHELSFQNYVVKGIDPLIEEEFTGKVKLLISSFERYVEFMNHFSVSH
jgi:hypothetical protein